MPSYKPGDTVICYFPYDDGRLKIRPGLVIGSRKGKLFVVSQITTRDRSERLAGEWIPAGSSVCDTMGLDRSSFINMNNLKVLPASFLIKKIGRYEPWDDFEERFAKIIAELTAD